MAQQVKNFFRHDKIEKHTKVAKIKIKIKVKIKMEYSSCSSYDSSDDHRHGLEPLHGESTLGLIPWVASYDTPGYGQEVTIKLLKNLHITGDIMATMLNCPCDDEGPIPRRIGNKLLTAQDVIEYIQETNFDCLDVCIDQRIVNVNDGTQSYKITAIGPLSASTTWSTNNKQVKWFTSGDKFCIKCEVRTYNCCYEYGISIELHFDCLCRPASNPPLCHVAHVPEVT